MIFEIVNVVSFNSIDGEEPPLLKDPLHLKPNSFQSGTFSISLPPKHQVLKFLWKSGDISYEWDYLQNGEVILKKKLSIPLASIRGFVIFEGYLEISFDHTLAEFFEKVPKSRKWTVAKDFTYNQLQSVFRAEFTNSLPEFLRGNLQYFVLLRSSPEDFHALRDPTLATAFVECMYNFKKEAKDVLELIRFYQAALKYYNQHFLN